MSLEDLSVKDVKKNVVNYYQHNKENPQNLIKGGIVGILAGLLFNLLGADSSFILMGLAGALASSVTKENK